MNDSPRIYLDNAATSWPKPAGVYAAMDSYQREVGASAGRGAYRHAQQAQKIVEEARRGVAGILGIKNAQQIAFTSNGTDALNLAIHGLLERGDHVVTTVCEHNSVLRPLSFQQKYNGVEISYVDCNVLGYVDLVALRKAIRSNTKLVTVSHASNVTGAIQPLSEIAELAHARHVFLLVDAAQTTGCVPIDVEQLEIDFLASGGHKSLLGPLGTGILYVRPGLEPLIQPLRQGGTGTDSQFDFQPDKMPDKLEAGNLNVPALAGLAAATNYLQEHSVAAIQQHLHDLMAQLWDGFAEIDGIRLVGPSPSESRVSVVSCAMEGYDPQEVAAALDASYGIECRAGLHCAPRMHSALGTDRLGGLIRFSPGWATTPEEIEHTIAALTAFAAG